MRMMEDMELLELAAKKAGIAVNFADFIDGGCWTKYRIGMDWWNPLADDGDALRLAVKLGIDFRNSSASEVVATHGGYVVIEAVTPQHRRAEATRRAIVRAAAGN